MICLNEKTGKIRNGFICSFTASVRVTIDVNLSYTKLKLPLFIRLMEKNITVKRIRKCTAINEIKNPVYLFVYCKNYLNI